MRLIIDPLLRRAAHITRNVFLFLLALQILNLSTNSIDFQPFHTSNLYEFNDLNTIVEYVTEIVLKHENAFPESGQQATPKPQVEKHVSFKLFVPDAITILQEKDEPVIRHITPISDSYRYLFFKEINPPPPKC